MSEFGDALGSRDGVSSEMHMQAVSKRVRRCTCRLRFSELRDVLGGRDGVSREIQLEAVNGWTLRRTPRP